MEIKALWELDLVENSHTPAQVRPQTTARAVW